MATDEEEFDSGVLLVCSTYRDLQSIDPNNPLLSAIELAEVGFKAGQEYHDRFVRPFLRRPDGQLCLWSWAYPNQTQARINGLVGYYNALSIAIKTEISERRLRRLVELY